MSFFELQLLVTPLVVSHLTVVSSIHGHGEGPLDKTLYGKVVQTVAIGRWFSLDTPISSINKTDRHDITEVLLKVALNAITLTLIFLDNLK